MGTGTAPTLTAWHSRKRLTSSPPAFIKISFKPRKEEENPTATSKPTCVLRAGYQLGFEQPPVPAASFLPAFCLDDAARAQITLTPVPLEQDSGLQEETVMDLGKSEMLGENQ